MKIKHLITALICSFGVNIAHANSWTWATEATYPPFESTLANGDIVGYDADLMQAICKNIHHSCTLVNAPFTSLIPSLNIGKYDAIIGGLAITKARQKVINFSSSYYQDSVIFVLPHDSNNTTITNQTIGVQVGTSFQAFLHKFYPSVTIKTYPSNMNALMDLKAGRVDAVLIDQPVFSAWLQDTHNQSQFKTAIAATTPAQKASLGLIGNGIGIAKNNLTMLADINTALSALKHNGTLKTLQHKWFTHA